LVASNIWSSEIPEPEPKPGYAVIEVKALGINHAEMPNAERGMGEAVPVSGIKMCRQLCLRHARVSTI
jgi:NADPH:quinone reductase-like Zn-dependent oxidoreductase